MIVSTGIFVGIGGEILYYLTAEESKYLLKGLVHRAREIGVDDELRGWNWNKPPLQPIYDAPLGLFEIAGQYCPTGRDVYLRNVLKAKSEPSYKMKLGAVLHKTLATIFQKTKKLIYVSGVEKYQDIFLALEKPDQEIYNKFDLEDEDKEQDLKNKVVLVWDYTRIQVIDKIQETLARQPYIGEDSLVSISVPFVLEQRLNGSFLGLSRHLSTDAFNFAEPMVLDTKFGIRQKFHPLYTAGYALVMESIYEYPVNLGCIVYAWFRDNRLFLDKQIHMISDELRQWFIEERDRKMRLVFDEIDPGIEEDKCPEECPYFSYCLK